MALRKYTISFRDVTRENFMILRYITRALLQNRYTVFELLIARNLILKVARLFTVLHH